jgi:O-antigen/teichoic acid export membrane protein
VKWGAVSTLTTAVLQLGLMALMARLLAPADFGLVATANVALRFLSYFAQLGIAPALIQKPSLEEGDVAAAMSVSLSISTMFASAALVLAPVAQWFFEMPMLGWVMAALAPNFVVAGFGSVSLGLLRRQMRFRALALIEVASYVLGYAFIGVGSAWFGAGVWALVLATLSQTLVSVLLSYACVRHSLRLRHSRHQRHHFLSFGGKYAMVGFLEFLSSNFDAMLIGKLLGPAAAGLYNRASLLANLPVDKPTTVFTRALFPMLSSLGSDRDKQSLGAQVSIVAVGGYAFAVSAGIAVAAPDIVACLLGPRWGDAAPALTVLALGVGPAFVTHVIGVTFESLGKLGLKLRVQVATLLALFLSMVALGRYGLVGIAAAVVIAEVLRAGTYSVLLHREYHLPRPYWSSTVVVVALAAGCAGTGVELAVLWAPAHAPVAIRLAADVAGGAAGLALAILLLRPVLARQAAVRQLRAHIRLLDRFLPAV